MKAKPVQIQTIAESLIQSDNYFDIRDSENNIIFEGSDFVRELLQLYYDWYFEFIEVGAFTEPIQWVKEIWNSYKNKNLDNWRKAAATYNLEYNPLDTYSREIETSYKNTRTFQHGKTTTTTATDYTTETEYNSDVSDQTTTFNNPLYRNATKNTHGGKDTTTLNGEIENAESGTDTITDTRLKSDNVVSENGRNGNSLTDEVTKEVNFRLSKDLSDSIIEGFVKKYLFLLPYGMGCVDWF